MRMIDVDEVKKRFPIMENDFGMVINERLHKELDKIPTVEAIPKDQINKTIEKIEQYICDVETDTVKAQGMAQALDMFEQTLGGLENGNDS